MMHMKTKLYGKDSFSIDKETVDRCYVEQLVDAEQTAALSYFLRYGLEQIIDGQKTVQETAESIDETDGSEGLASILQLLYSLRTCKAPDTGTLCLPEPVQRIKTTTSGG